MVKKTNKKKKIIFTLAIMAFLVIISGVFTSNYSIYRGENIMNSLGRVVFILSKNKAPESSKIVLVNRPFSQNEEDQLFARCIAEPGETIEIIDSEVFINNETENADYPISHSYRVNCFTDEATNRLLEEYKLIDSVDVLGVYNLNLTLKEAEILKNDSLIKINKIIIDKDLGNKDIFPQSYKYRWNEDNFGPVLVPYKGLKIDLSINTFSLYKNTIIYFEKKEIRTENDKYFIGSDEITDYTFENDYYFVMNDNRADYVDSRTWGMIPKNQIEATVVKKMK